MTPTRLPTREAVSQSIARLRFDAELEADVSEGTAAFDAAAEIQELKLRVRQLEREIFNRPSFFRAIKP